MKQNFILVVKWVFSFISNLIQGDSVTVDARYKIEKVPNILYIYSTCKFWLTPPRLKNLILTFIYKCFIGICNSKGNKYNKSNEQSLLDG